MILVDTAVWIDHFHRSNPDLVSALEQGEVVTHPFVIGELACGTIRNREEILDLLSALPVAPIASHEEAMLFVEEGHLMGRGLGYIDVHLLASVTLDHDLRLLTRDKKLLQIARELQLA